MRWSIVYERAIRDDGSLFFPQKLTQEFLDNAKRTMGSYVFSNQYQNEIIPLELQTFKQHWFKYYKEIPNNVHNFVFIDPALSEADTSDFTGITVISVDSEKNWYIPYAKRHKLTPTQLISFIFELYNTFRPKVIGIETVAYQKALLYFLDEEMRRRSVVLPVKGISYPPTASKQTRILSLVPRFEWGHVFMAQGLNDLEMELLKFPRGSHDDLIDSLASQEFIVFYPPKEKIWDQKPAPNSPDYEQWYRSNLFKSKQGEE